MKIKNIKIQNYKNIQHVETHLDAEVVCLSGKNGAGKTNFIDAIYYLSTTKSYFNHIDNQNIRFGEKFFFLGGTFYENNQTSYITCSYSTELGKIVKNNDKKYSKFSLHYGNFPVIMLCPDDVDLIRDDSKTRQNYFDSIICISDKKYLSILNEYKKVLQQRNSFLKSPSVSEDLLEIYDFKIIKLSEEIYKTRKTFVEEFIKYFVYAYSFFTTTEKLSIKYKSQLENNDIAKLIKEKRAIDLTNKTTNVGIHRDDYLFEINGEKIKKFGSQGQQKTFLIALKFAEYQYILKKTNIKAILLFDDIFDKLDLSRIEKLMELIKIMMPEQVFFTHTDANFLHSVLDNLQMKYLYLTISDGNVLV